MKFPRQRQIELVNNLSPWFLWHLLLIPEPFPLAVFRFFLCWLFLLFCFWPNIQRMHKFDWSVTPIYHTIPYTVVAATSSYCCHHFGLWWWCGGRHHIADIQPYHFWLFMRVHPRSLLLCLCPSASPTCGPLPSPSASPFSRSSILHSTRRVIIAGPLFAPRFCLGLRCYASKTLAIKIIFINLCRAFTADQQRKIAKKKHPGPKMQREKKESKSN